MTAFIAKALERLSWILEDAAERINRDAAVAETRRQDQYNRDPLIDRI